MEIYIPRPNTLHKAVKRIASSSVGAQLLSHTLHHLDRMVAGMTGGGSALTTIFTGLPVLTLTCQGRTSGKPREVPLIGIPRGNQIVLIASNWGRASHPAWYRNLKAHPSAILSFHGGSARYTAREVEGEERGECWIRAVEVYPGYEAYKRRARARQIPVMLLAPETG